MMLITARVFVFVLVVLIFWVSTLRASVSTQTSSGISIDQVPNLDASVKARQSTELALPMLCTVAVFKVIEKRTNRIKVVSAVLGDSARYGTLILQPRTCEMHKYAGGHHNAIAYVDVWTLPYRAMQEIKFSYAFSPTLMFSGYMSTISPTFTHRNYEIIAMECKTEACPVEAPSSR